MKFRYLSGCDEQCRSLVEVIGGAPAGDDLRTIFYYPFFDKIIPKGYKNQKKTKIP
jgi:hypothetical protein